MSKRGRSPTSLVPPLPVAAFIFRRDLRLHDNTALLQLHSHSHSSSSLPSPLPLLPLFFFNPQQCEAGGNPYFGRASVEFMTRSLHHLQETQLHGRLVCLKGTDQDCLETLQAIGYEIKYLGFNCDFTPFARERDAKLMNWCQERGVECVTSVSDYTLLPLTTVTTGTCQPYRVFTPFYQKVMQHHFKDIPAPNVTSINVEEWFISIKVKNDIVNAIKEIQKKNQYIKKEKMIKKEEIKKEKEVFMVENVELSELPSIFPQLPDKGGRDEGLSRLEIVKNSKNYAEERNDIPGDHTTHLSPHLKFGTISIREAMHFSLIHLGKNHMFIRQLIWREFYAMLLFHNPRLVKNGQIKDSKQNTITSLNEPFDIKYIKFRWNWDDNAFTAFKEGKTGFPLVDAAVRCLNETGWCHNRCRMIIANFLVKVLFVDWREGERWYATVAVDYDVANNSGGWLWSSGQGADAQPFFRTFNPFRQSTRFDPNAIFIKKWVPELRNVPAKTIHEWDVYCKKHRGQEGEKKKSNEKLQQKTLSNEKNMDGSLYPSPIVDLKERTKWVIEQFKKHNEKCK